LLSASLDTVGPIARDVADAAALYEILFDEPAIVLGEVKAGDVRLLALEGSVLSALDDATRGAFASAIEALGKRGIRVERRALASVEAAAQVTSPAGYEAYQLYGPRIEESPGLVWELVAERVLAGKSITREAYAAALARLSDLSRQFKEETRGYNAVLMPTVAMTAPAIFEVEASADAYRAINVRALSLPSLANRLGLCAMSIPLPSTQLPIGLTLLGRPLDERQLLPVAALLERLLAT
jgi:aspartyl-tRNA(Asn)/glutamyl-tRNA(Gln) amidotransferase subunit A